MNLACPGDGATLDASLRCPHGHAYRAIEGIPILLRDDVAQTMEVAGASLRAAADPARDAPLQLDSVGISTEQKVIARELARAGGPVDPVVAMLIAATSGHAYRHLVGTLAGYPIPEIRLENGEGRRLLDIGCNWGRWSIAAARKGYEVVGIDPSIGALLAAQRVSRGMGLSIRYVCADARYLPFAAEAFDTVYSYSVIQHFSKPDAVRTFQEIARVLDTQGISLVQMAHAIGVRSLWHQARRGFTPASGFDVRYWTVGELRGAMAPLFREVDMSVHCFFGLGLEASDAALMPLRVRAAIRASEALRRASRRLRPLLYAADSIYVRCEGPLSPAA